ncbi:tRNA uridine-5-carboxymethylaminomethyl(34) synthesis GTPase MnmE [Methylotetracoccus oryzae]|uniref:tRNA uridine-5-carboxymethylaminomethyl(34) synthesis GTPase MnmE n=1 Tax=Methylotetracoccus oryzae TaxID=1919059 RepID=UPI0011189E85|nr:tRNA uridine-5-carboxymethylaminomethyl(34) synthesis GTPase MnmE [Methylotetracoccus oryzae]
MIAPACHDTIAAIATPPGRGGVSIVRVSGPGVGRVVAAILAQTLDARRARLCRFRDHDGSVIDEGLALYFPGPHSFSGEDMLELHGHGGPVVSDLLLQRVLSAGARLAQPGEFTERAFLNGKIDLAQAEAVADLIDAATEQAARSAQRSLQGDFSKHIAALCDELVWLRTYVEAAIDFSDEEIDFLNSGQVSARLGELSTRLDALVATARQGELLRDGLTVVIAGRPNVGKSSLLNRLAGRDTAIVTDIAGTTRDLLREHIQIDGLPLHVIDTAGIHDAPDRVEQEGIRRARAAIAEAGRVLLVLDDRFPEQGEELLQELPAGVPITRVHNKTDLTNAPPRIEVTPSGTHVYLSAETGAGLSELRQHLKDCAGYRSEEGGIFMARRRHLEALRRTRQTLDQAMINCGASNPELFADDLRAAHEALGEITGRFTTEDLLGSIFSSFCIGK